MSETTSQWKPELLSPAGSLDKLKAALSYGADAVYLAGQKFGLRTAADNFTLDELEEGLTLAQSKQAKIFVVLNSFLHDSDMADLATFVSQIEELGVHAVIASDLGVISTVSKVSKLPIHLSTQASCLNRYSAQAWKKMGVSRLIFGREVSIENAGAIKKQTGLEVELFIHGSMCMAYSGNCTISNYTQGRDSNRGGCAQSCRFKYELDFSGSTKLTQSTFLSSKDLMGIEYLPEFFKYKIDSLKIEGRMRSALYAAEISKIYRDAIDCYAYDFNNQNKSSHEPHFTTQKLSQWQNELNCIPHREYTEANLIKPANASSVYLADKPTDKEKLALAPGHSFLGVVRKVVPDQYSLVEVSSLFYQNEPVKILPFKGALIDVFSDPDGNKLSTQMSNSVGEPITKAIPNSLVRLPFINGVQPGQIVLKGGAN